MRTQKENENQMGLKIGVRISRDQLSFDKYQRIFTVTEGLLIDTLSDNSNIVPLSL